jgi:hypothetical protein
MNICTIIELHLPCQGAPDEGIQGLRCHPLSTRCRYEPATRRVQFLRLFFIVFNNIVANLHFILHNQHIARFRRVQFCSIPISGLCHPTPGGGVPFFWRVSLQTLNSEIASGSSLAMTDNICHCERPAGARQSRRVQLFVPSVALLYGQIPVHA